MKKDLEIILYVGPPATGKSTDAKKFIKENPNYVRVSRDDFRYMLKDQGFCEPKIEWLITELVNTTILNALKNSLNVIVDNTNVKLKTINEFISLFQEYANISFKVFDIPIEICLERDKLREKSVGEDVIKRMFDDFEILKSTFDFQPVKKTNIFKERFYLKQDDILPHAIIVDVDGTLALNNNKRNIFDETKVELDDVNEPVANMVRKYQGKIIITSGRKDSCKELTEKWLKDNNIPYDYLFMRKSDDIRKDSIIKREIFEENIRDKFFIEYCLDDRDQVISTWRDLGLLALQVHYGDF